MDTREFGCQALLFRRLDSLKEARHIVIKVQRERNTVVNFGLADLMPRKPHEVYHFFS
jgi:hypothetical protein